jgi:endo-1,4-beta-xylanase
MKHLIPILSIFVLAISSCAPPATPVPSPTLAPTMTPIPRTQAVLSQATTLYSGPGDVNYESLASLPAGTTVYPSGTYGDFVQAAALIAGNEVTGFIWKNAMENLPGDLPVLDRLQVPWEPFFSPICSPGKYDVTTGTVTFDSVSADEGFYTNSEWWTVTAPIRIQINALKAKGNTWGDKSSNTEWSDFRIAGSTVVAIRSKADGGTYEVDIYKSIGGDVAKAVVVPRNSSGPIQVLFDQPADNKRIGTSFSVLDGTGKVLTTVDLTTLPEVSLPDGLFPDKQLYFGTDTSANSSLALTGLSIGSQPTGQWVEQANLTDYLVSPGLSKAAKGKAVTVGSSFIFDRAIDRRYCQIMQHDFNLATTGDFTLKWAWPANGQYAWGIMDREVDFAAQRGWRVRAYLGWGSPEAIPDWLLQSKYTRDEYITILQDYMKAVIGHFKGRVQEWVIANEATARILCDNDGFYDFWYQRIGSDYIKLEFQTARAVDPGAILIFNDGDNHSANYPPPYDCRNGTIKKMQDTVSELNAGPDKLIDGIGMEMHLLGPGDTLRHDKQDLIQIMQGFSKLGVRVYITEMDVDLGLLQSKYPTREERWKYEAGIYKDVVEACLESGACDSFSTMDVADSQSAIVTSCPTCSWYKPDPNGDPDMFDANFLPKPAYFAVRDALTSTIATATSNP